MFDPKPDAPAEIRGEFQAIAVGVAWRAGVGAFAAREPLARSDLFDSHGVASLQQPQSLCGDDRLHRRAGSARLLFEPDQSSEHGLGVPLRRADSAGRAALCRAAGVSGLQPGFAACGSVRRLSRQPLQSAVQPVQSRPSARVVADRDFYNPTLRPIGDPTLPSLDAIDDARRARSPPLAAASRSISKRPLLESSTAYRDMDQRQRQAFDLLMNATLALGVRSGAGTDQRARTLWPRPVRLQRACWPGGSSRRA